MQALHDPELVSHRSLMTTPLSSDPELLGQRFLFPFSRDYYAKREIGGIKK